MQIQWNSLQTSKKNSGKQEKLDKGPFSPGFLGGASSQGAPNYKKGRFGGLLGREDPLEEGMATHSSVLACRIPWTGEPGGLLSMGLQKSQTGLKRLSISTRILCQASSCPLSCLIFMTVLYSSYYNDVHFIVEKTKGSER